jgi:hypothetical protein
MPMVALSEARRRCGETHPRARVPDVVVAAIRDAHESGIGLRRLARMFALPRSTVQGMCNYTRRAVRIDVWIRCEGRHGKA